MLNLYEPIAESKSDNLKMSAGNRGISGKHSSAAPSTEEQVLFLAENVRDYDQICAIPKNNLPSISLSTFRGH